MIDCNAVREALALQPLNDDAELRDHLDQCSACAGYRKHHQALDVVLRDELRWEVPAALTARLLALAADPAALTDVPLALSQQDMLAMPQPTRPIALPARPRPQRWYVTAVYVLTATVIGLSLAVAWQFFGMLAMQAGIDTALTQLIAAPAQGLSLLARALPESRYLIDFFLKVRTQLMWLLLVAVLWAALDKWNVQFSFRRRQVSS
jgi:hypothetical protein